MTEMNGSLRRVSCRRQVRVLLLGLVLLPLVVSFTPTTTTRQSWSSVKVSPQDVQASIPQNFALHDDLTKRRVQFSFGCLFSLLVTCSPKLALAADVEGSTLGLLGLQQATVQVILEETREPLPLHPVGYFSSLTLVADEDRLPSLPFSLPSPPKFPDVIQRRVDQLEAYRKLQAEDNAAKVREYDELFQKDARDRDEYYGKMALETKQKAERLQIQEQRDMAEGVFGDVVPIAPPQTDEELAMETEKNLAKQKETLTKEETKGDDREQKRLQHEIEVLDSLKKIKAERMEEVDRIQARREQSIEKQQSSMEKFKEVQRQQDEEFMAKMRTKQQELEDIKDRQDQQVFEARMDAIDTFLTRKEKLKRN